VSLPRPNDDQAQADPDGLANGGVDQPGGLGGVAVTDQDGNNGSGNDVDCEDDNNGVGIPGHCRDAGGAPGTDVDVPEAPTLPGIGTAAPAPVPASAVLPPAVVVRAPGAWPVAAAGQRASALPDTGASATLWFVGLGGLATLLIGAGLTVLRRRAAP
jgi:LPXTG-motif cell wall-anchored protein